MRPVDPNSAAALVRHPDQPAGWLYFNDNREHHQINRQSPHLLAQPSIQGSIWVGPLAYWGTEEIALKDTGMLRIGRDQRVK